MGVKVGSGADRTHADTSTSATSQTTDHPALHLTLGIFMRVFGVCVL
jgi:hypothetical protein